MRQQSAPDWEDEVFEIYLPNVCLCGSEADRGVQQHADEETPH
jgi:hypothetical protein